ncbi:MAG: hypothetical protein Crog4KO_05290 [Crocinitomicaceae bacterium]
MNYHKLLLVFLLSVSFGVSAQEQTEQRYQHSNYPNNSLENPASYAAYDRYKVAKAKGALVYGRDYIFEGISASEVTQQMIDDVDPYSYLTQFKRHQKVEIDVQSVGVTLILFPTNNNSNTLNENE